MSEPGSAVTDDLPNQGGGPSSFDAYGQFIHYLYDEGKKTFHTEVQNPEGMTGADVYAGYLTRHDLRKSGKLLQDFQSWKRTNMIAYKRKREEATVKIAQAQVEAERAKKSLEETLAGFKR